MVGKTTKSNKTKKSTSKVQENYVETETPILSDNNRTKKSTSDFFLHLPIKMSDLDRIKNVNNNSYENDISDDNTPINENIFKIASLKTDVGESESSDELCSMKYREATQEIKKLTDEIHQLKNELSKYRKEDDRWKVEGGEMEVQMDIKFIDHINGEQLVAECSDKRCWWCHHTFDGPPCMMPEKYIDGFYHVWGNFCSFGCAAAYNFDMNDNLTWHRHSMLKKIYNMVFNNHKDVPIAKSWKVLDVYGGVLSIDEYRRNNILMKRDFLYKMPPMICNPPYIKMISKIECDRRKKNDLVLFRKKPLPREKNTVMESLRRFGK